MKYFVLILFIILTFAKINLCQIVEPTRTIDLWHPFGTSTTRKPGTAPKEDEVIVRLAIGDIVGKKNYLFDLPWTVNHDPSEVTNPELGEQDPNPVPPYNNATIFSFLGLPYAMPPISERRFKPPQQLVVLPGDSPYLAFDYRPSCAQDVESRQKVFINEPYPYLTDEDCLYLNVFTPEASKSSNLFYPVVVFFHGGNFQTGSGNEWPGHVLASRGLVVVTVNYRLGAFGFMSLGDEKTSNFGIKDQRMALQWVQQYIAAFGGDNQAVTIIGHDAGAVSAGIHMLAEESKGLFRGVVAMSGAEVSYHSIIGKAVLAYNNTIKLGRYLGCTQAVAENVWDCILQRSSDDIVEALSPAGNPPVPIEFNRYMFMPSIDGRELKAHPLWLLQNVGSGNVNIASAVPYLTGLNQHDGSEVILEDRTLGEFTNFLEVDHAYQQSWVYEYSFRHNYTMNREAIAEAIDNYYTFWPDPADVWKIREKFIELTTDTYYTAPISLSAHLHSATGSRTFMYVNNYNFSKTRENTPSQKYFPPWMGTCHECDLYLLFGFPFMPRKLLPKHFQPIEWYETDRNASYLFGAFVRQFIKKSDPNLPFTGLWPAHQPRAHWYANFNYTYGASVATVGEIKRDYRYQEIAFWNNYIPALVNYMTTTFPPWEVRERRQVVTMTVITIVLAIVLLVVTVIALSLVYCVCNREERRRFLYKQHFVRIQENNQSTQQLEMDRMSSL